MSMYMFKAEIKKHVMKHRQIYLDFGNKDKIVGRQEVVKKTIVNEKIKSLKRFYKDQAPTAVKANSNFGNYPSWQLCCLVARSVYFPKPKKKKFHALSQKIVQKENVEEKLSKIRAIFGPGRRRLRP